MAALALLPIDRTDLAEAAGAARTASETLATMFWKTDLPTTPVLTEVGRQLAEALHATLGWQRRSAADDELLAALAKWL